MTVVTSKKPNINFILKCKKVYFNVKDLLFIDEEHYYLKEVQD